jgi:WD40 repeat protein
MCSAFVLFRIGAVDAEQNSLNNGPVEGVMGVPRRERPLESQDTALLRFAADLRRLREKAGSPTYRELSRRAHYSPAALSEAAGGRKLPSLAVTIAYVTACGDDPAGWRTRWQAVNAELHAVAAHHDVGRDEDDRRAPYVGLAAFQAADAEWFFGRDKVIKHLLTRVCERRFLGVFGASGSGKSSVLRAGLIARASTSGLSGTGPQPTLVFTPGPHPLEECAVQLASYTGESVAVLRNEFSADPQNLHLRIRQALAGTPADVDLVLVIDQFEEVFTLCADPAERAGYIAALIFAASTPTSRARVVLGVRADFYGHCGQHPELVEALSDGQILIGSMTHDELRAAITGPAATTGAMVESALVTRLITDANGQPGVLPLVSHALLETWRRRRGATLTLAGYEAAGGIQHAIARSAEHAYTTLTPAQQAVAKQIFLRLTALDEATDDTKRRIHRGELDTDDPDTVVVLERLTQARLVVVDQNSIDIAHEALIRSWPRLHGWLTEDREGLKVHRELVDATQAWEGVHRDPGALYRGTRLALAGDWAATHETELTPREWHFLEASQAAETTELNTARRHTRRLRRLVAVLATLLLAAATATGVAVRAQDAATQQRNLAIARKAASDATTLRATNSALAIQLSLAAYRLAPVPDTRNDLLSTFATPYTTRLAGHTNIVRSVAFSPDGRVMATGSIDHTVRLWDVSDIHHPAGLAIIASHTSEVYSVVFNPDGRVLATASSDKTIRLWDVTDFRHPRALTTITGRGFFSLAFSPDGRVLAAAEGDRLARLWDVSDIQHPTELPALIGHTHAIMSVAFSPDGHTLATGSNDQTARLWDISDAWHPREQATLTGHTDSVWSVAFSPDGHILATGSWDHTIRLWDVSQPSQPRELATLTGHTNSVYQVRFNSDGRMLATTGADYTTRLWDVSDPHHPGELPTFTSQANAVYAVAFSPDDRTLVTANPDNTMRLTDMSDVVRHPVTVYTVAYSPNGHTLATGDADHTTRLLDVSDVHHPHELARLTNDNNYVLAVTFSPDGHMLATSSSGGDEYVGTTRLWNVEDPLHPEELATIPENDGYVFSVVFSPDGRTLVTGGGTSDTDMSAKKAVTRLWDVSEPRHPREIAALTGHTDYVSSMAFTPDGHTLATTSIDRTARLWDVSDVHHPREVAPLAGYADYVSSMTISPDGHTLAATNVDETVRLWDFSDPRRPRELAVLPAHTEYSSMAFSPDGRTLATGSSNNDKTVRLWDVSDAYHPRGLATLSGHTDSILFMAFHPDGNSLVTASADHTVRLWDTDPERVATRICDIANPPITSIEWNQNFPGLNYEPPCLSRR